MKKVVRLTESDMNRLVRRIINEGACPAGPNTTGELTNALYQSSQGKDLTLNAKVTGQGSCWYLIVNVNGREFNCSIMP